MKLLLGKSGIARFLGISRRFASSLVDAGAIRDIPGSPGIFNGADADRIRPYIGMSREKMIAKLVCSYESAESADNPALDDEPNGDDQDDPRWHLDKISRIVISQAMRDGWDFSGNITRLYLKMPGVTVRWSNGTVFKSGTLDTERIERLKAFVAEGNRLAPPIIETNGSWIDGRHRSALALAKDGRFPVIVIPE